MGPACARYALRSVRNLHGLCPYGDRRSVRARKMLRIRSVRMEQYVGIARRFCTLRLIAAKRGWGAQTSSGRGARPAPRSMAWPPPDPPATRNRELSTRAVPPRSPPANRHHSGALSVAAVFAASDGGRKRARHRDRRPQGLPPCPMRRKCLGHLLPRPSSKRAAAHFSFSGHGRAFEADQARSRLRQVSKAVGYSALARFCARRQADLGAYSFQGHVALDVAGLGKPGGQFGSGRHSVPKRTAHTRLADRTPGRSDHLAPAAEASPKPLHGPKAQQRIPRAPWRKRPEPHGHRSADAPPMVDLPWPHSTHSTDRIPGTVLLRQTLHDSAPGVVPATR